jgi:hypothetical protein
VTAVQHLARRLRVPIKQSKGLHTSSVHSRDVCSSGSERAAHCMSKLSKFFG